MSTDLEKIEKRRKKIERNHKLSAAIALKPMLDRMMFEAMGVHEQWQARWEERRTAEVRVQLAALKAIKGMFVAAGPIEPFIKTVRKLWDADTDALVERVDRVLSKKLKTYSTKASNIVGRIIISVIPEAVQSTSYTVGVVMKAEPFPNLREVTEKLGPELVDEVTASLERSFQGYGHDLAQMIVEAADPANPMTIPQLAKKLRSDWLGISAKRSQLIARTESARVYGRATYETYRALGAQKYRWLTAAGSPVAATSPVCEFCQIMAAQGLADVEDGFSAEVEVGVRDPHMVTVEAKYPPYHPSCRCDIAMDTENWTPPIPEVSGG